MEMLDEIRRFDPGAKLTYAEPEGGDTRAFGERGPRGVPISCPYVPPVKKQR